MGFIAAVAFATILAVVAGLTLAAASALSHDIFVSVFRKGQASEREQVKVARISVVIFGVVAILLGILFKGQNVAFMVGCLRHCREREFPCPASLHSLEEVQHGGSRRLHPGRFSDRHPPHYPQPHGLGRRLSLPEGDLPA